MLINEIIEGLIERKEIKGTFTSNIFESEIYANSQTDYLKGELNQNNYIDYSKLKNIGITQNGKDYLKSLVKNKHLEEIIDEESIVICALLHDMSKMNFYEKTFKNVKVYSEYGSKRDEGGTFDWVAQQSYKTVDVEKRFLYGNHEETSEFMIRQYIPLKLEESVAILNHHFSMSYDCVPIESVSLKHERYPLACLLHVADMISTYIDERA